MDYKEYKAMIKDEDNSLEHYGVLGMHWGHHKAKSEDHIKSRQIRKKSISSMTNEELSTVTRRLQLEKQYKDINTTVLKKGKKTASSILANAAKSTAASYTSKFMTSAVDSWVKDVFVTEPNKTIKF